MVDQFTWIPIYQELAKKLIDWEQKQTQLISFLEKLRTEGYVITPLTDKDRDGARFLLKEIDPFTFFGVFNRRIRQDQRTSILAQMKRHFKLQCDLPEDFNGVPVLNNLKSWFIPDQTARQLEEVGKLWRVFRLGLGEDPLGNEQFLEAFDAALTVKQTNVNLTMGLFWIRPGTFLNLDQNNREYLSIRLPADGLTAKFYAEMVRLMREEEKPFSEISLAAWGAENERVRRVAESQEAQYR